MVYATTDGPEAPGRKPLYQDVVESVFESLIDGRIVPGERLAEHRIAAELGVSRSPVRQALQEMARQGIVVLIPEVGARVTTWNATDVQDFGRFRALTEGLAAEQATLRMQPSELESLASNLADFHAAIENGVLRETIEADIAFHKTIAHASHNTSVTLTFEAMQLRVRMFLIIQKHLYPSVAGQKDALSHHQAVYKALQERNAGQARELMAYHIQSATAGLLERMQKGAAGTGAPEVPPIVDNILRGRHYGQALKRINRA